MPPHSSEPDEAPTGPVGGAGGGAGPGDEDIDPEVARQLAAQLAEAQQRILSEPIELHVSNHVMGLYELAAIHLSAEEPDLSAARLPIDAMGLLIENLGDRLAERATLTAALQQIRLAYVQAARGHDDAADEAGGHEAGGDEAGGDEAAGDEAAGDEASGHEADSEAGGDEAGGGGPAQT